MVIVSSAAGTVIFCIGGLAATAASSSGAANSMFSCSTDGTPIRPAATAPTAASGSCTIRSGWARSASAITSSANEALAAPNSLPTKATPARPAISRRPMIGCRSSTRVAVRPKLKCGAMSWAGIPAVSVCSTSPPLASSTS